MTSKTEMRMREAMKKRFALEYEFSLSWIKTNLHLFDNLIMVAMVSSAANYVTRAAGL